MTKQIKEVSFHRNGVGGLGFHAVLFTETVEAISKEEAKNWNVFECEEHEALFLATVFDEPGACALICLDRISEHGVKFGMNSWRGDRYEGWLREQIKTNESSGSVRIGPFALPTG